VTPPGRGPRSAMVRRDRRAAAFPDLGGRRSSRARARDAAHALGARHHHGAQRPRGARVARPGRALRRDPHRRHDAGDERHGSVRRGLPARSRADRAHGVHERRRVPRRHQSVLRARVQPDDREAVRSHRAEEAARQVQAATGRTIRTVVPTPTSLSICSLPPAVPTRRWQLARPSPVPPARVVNHGVPTRSSTSGGMPGP
jgi:hypothetical protein